jgi:catechol 2,3-dioxygenase-like lactoylglutathione lyase family enzyme
LKVIINIDVPALQPAIDFYCGALGLELARLLDSDVAELAGASAMVYLLQHARGSHAVGKPAIERDYQRHWTPVHFDLVVPDIDAAVARALAAGALQEAGPVHWRGSHCVSFGDPFGHGFCLIAFENNETYGD